MTAARKSLDVELFAGAGGMALGLAAAGFLPSALCESDPVCCKTLDNNKASHFSRTTVIRNEDITNANWSDLVGCVALLSGGPPCQPFSVGGKQLASKDDRDHFPSVVRAVRQIRPLVVLLENVPGLVRGSMRTYLEYIARQLALPDLAREPGEDILGHSARLARELGGGEPEYRVQWWVLNAADYGLPQARVRLFMVATVSGIEVKKPLATHGRRELMLAQDDGSYWERHGLPPRRRREWPKRLRGESSYVAKVKPWVTVRDVVVALGPPIRAEAACHMHGLIQGARVYEGHSGSEYDWPAKTIKAGVHGVSGGENVLCGKNTRRYFTLREMARLQGFPDDYEFSGSRSAIIRQIGNAVPPLLAQIVGQSIQLALTKWRTDSLAGARRARQAR